MLQAMVARGDTGLEAGRGFYDWAGLDAGAVRADASARLRALLEMLERLRPAATPRVRRRDELP
jgi:3-hydroxybutyryl-CoA dehydrogenase